MSNWNALPAVKTSASSYQLQARAEMEKRRRERQTLTHGVMWQPHPKNLPQQIAFASDADVIGYGGQAGGGKTDLLLGEALTHHKKSVIFRREATQLRDIIDRSRDLIGTRGNLNESLHIWRGLPGGRSLEFGGVKDDDDVEKWRGRAHDLKAFDEAPEFTESQIRFLIGWNRSTDPKQKCQTILAFNPPRTAEGRWILDFFAPWLDPKHPNPAQDGELRWYARLDDKDTERPNGEPFEHTNAAGVTETITPTSRTFIRARVTDNPYLADTDYVAKLQALPEPLRSQLLYGDFAAGVKDDAYQVIPTAWVKAAMDRWTNAKPARRITCIGADIARGGDDRQVLAVRYGNWYDNLIKIPGAEVPNGARAVSPLIELLETRGEATRIENADGTAQIIAYEDNTFRLPIVRSETPVNVDVVGIGSSAFDTARTHGLNAFAVSWGEKSSATDESGRLGFLNLRAEHWWNFRRALDPTNTDYAGDPVRLPPDAQLLADLTAPRYSVVGGNIKIESKDDLRKRLKRSPDCGDAVVMAHAQVGRASVDWI